MAASWRKQLDAHLPPLGSRTTSRLGHSMWVSWWKKRSLGRFFSGLLPFSLPTNFVPPFLDTHLVHFVSFHYICAYDGASGVVARHPSYSQIFNKGASSRVILCPGPFLHTSWYFFIPILLIERRTDLSRQCVEVPQHIPVPNQSFFHSVIFECIIKTITKLPTFTLHRSTCRAYTFNYYLFTHFFVWKCRIYILHPFYYNFVRPVDRIYDK